MTESANEKKNKWDNKWVRGAIPALLIHCSIGSVYAWSLFKNAIADKIGSSVSAVEWAFSLAIFFLGMSAAFGGYFVEKNIKKAALVSLVCFCSGLIGTGFAIKNESLLGVLLSYGVLMGVGLGIGYITPVKTLMLWFKDNKGLATGIAIAGFGLAKAIASPLMEHLQKTGELHDMFYVLAAVYFLPMLLCFILLKKPQGAEQKLQTQKFSLRALFSKKQFWAIWFIFYLNITCGLALISQEKPILLALDFKAVAFVSALTAVFNTVGRFGYSTLGDYLKSRDAVYWIIFASSVAACGLGILGVSCAYALVVILALCIINAGYGGGFSNLPSLLSDKFGMNHISTIHGLILSAWAFAGLSGNQLASVVVSHTGSYAVLCGILLVLYALAFGISKKL